MLISIRMVKNAAVTVGIVTLLIIASGCLAQNTPAPVLAAQLTQPAVASASPTMLTTALTNTQAAKLFDFASKISDSVIQDFKQCSGSYQDFKKPVAGSTADPGLTDKDYLLESLSVGMGGSFDWLNGHNNTNTHDYAKQSKLVILHYYYCKYLYDMVESGKLSVEQGKLENDNMLAFSGENTTDAIASIADQIDGGATFTQIRQNHPEWFTDANQPAVSKS